MTRALALTAAILAVAVSTDPALAEEQTGKVQEIIIKIETPNGPRWYKLGADLSKMEVREGAVVRFNYADDTIDSLQVEEVAPDQAPPTNK